MTDTLIACFHRVPNILQYHTYGKASFLVGKIKEYEMRDETRSKQLRPLDLRSMQSLRYIFERLTLDHWIWRSHTATPSTSSATEALSPRLVPLAARLSWFVRHFTGHFVRCSEQKTIGFLACSMNTASQMASEPL